MDLAICPNHHHHIQTSPRTCISPHPPPTIHIDFVTHPREDTFVPDTVQCALHGETRQTFVCTHLLGESSGLGFNREENPGEENPCPDAWCDDCEIIRAAHGSWDSVPEELCKIELLCSECYERCRIRNTRPSVTFDDLSLLRWKCPNCEDWHSGPCLDFGFSEPWYWKKEYENSGRWNEVSAEGLRTPSETFLDPDYCSIDGRDFFVRGIIHLPIIGAADSLRWGVWGSLSLDNFEKLLAMDDDPNCVDLPPMFSWLSSQISEYPDTLSLKMYAHIQEPGTRPQFRLERSDHPLSLEYHHGITPERVREIMLRGLRAVEL
jgi:hypothetical protein